MRTYQASAQLHGRNPSNGESLCWIYPSVEIRFQFSLIWHAEIAAAELTGLVAIGTAKANRFWRFWRSLRRSQVLEATSDIWKKMGFPRPADRRVVRYDG